MLNAPLYQKNSIYYFAQASLKPAIEQPKAPWVEVAGVIEASKVYAKGTVMAQLTRANTSDVQTISLAGGAAGKTFSLLTPWNTVLGPFAYNIATADLQTALQAVYGVGNITVGGIPGADYTLTGAGDLQYVYLPLLTLVNVTAGLTASIAHTTLGCQNLSFVQYDASTIASPTAAPTLTDGAAGTWPAGSYTGCYTWVNSAGESRPSPVGAYASLGTKKIHFAALAGIPNGVTAVNFYVDGQFAIQKAVAANAVAAFDVDLADVQAVVPVPPPTANTCYANTDGRATPIGVLKDSVVTDVFGNLSFGNNSGAQIPYTDFSALIVVKGYVRAEDLTGLDANAVAKLGRLVFGSVASGLLEIN